MLNFLAFAVIMIGVPLLIVRTVLVAEGVALGWPCGVLLDSMMIGVALAIAETLDFPAEGVALGWPCGVLLDSMMIGVALPIAETLCFPCEVNCTLALDWTCTVALTWGCTEAEVAGSGHSTSFMSGLPQ